MTFEFLITCDMTADSDIADVEEFLVSILTEILDDTENDFEDSMLQIHHIRRVNDSQSVSRNALIGFALDLPDDTTDVESVITEFTGALQDSPSVFHIVKFEDPLLQAELAEFAAEIFTLEMKLRRTLSIIYLNAYQGNDPFDLLRDETVGLPQRGRLNEEQMKEVSENQFFLLSFSGYIRLNQRAGINLENVLSIVRNADEYNAFRAEMLRQPVENEEDASFISNLKSIMDPIEQMRNCVAHNRRPTRKIREDYSTARPQLEALLTEHLARWVSQE